MRAYLIPLCVVLFATSVCGQDDRAVSYFALGDSTETISPKKSAYPGRKWKTQGFEVTNISKKDFYVVGHSPDHIFLQVFTKDPKTKKWVSRGLAYCGTGAGRHRIPPGYAFLVKISLPEEIADRPYRIEFPRYSKATAGKHSTERSKAFQMTEMKKGEQGDAVQPATAVDSKSKGKKKAKSESKGRSQ